MYYNELGFSLEELVNFPTVEKAIAYIKDKVADLFKLDKKLISMQEKIKKLKEIAQAKGDDKAYAALVTLESQVIESRKTQKDLEDQVSKLTEMLPEGSTQQEMGIVGIAIGALATIAIPLAAGLYLHYKKVAAHEKTLELIEKGLLTPEEARRLEAGQGLFTGLSDTLKYLAIAGAVGITGYYIIKRR
jgi:hypothetical protein